MDKPIEWSQVLAARISLRMLPLIIVGFEKGKPFSEDQLKWILSSFRATFISWAARRYPAHDMVSISARAAAYTTATTPTTISPRAVANAAVTTITATSAHIAAARAANVTITVSATATNAIATNAA
ncbi:MAG: hypothetical protein JKX91_01490, partial [Rhizobiaceae bacterium]|nr:hypothetical protein [Rhizobiaceae bacterium]